jgi:hypothetical protein
MRERTGVRCESGSTKSWIELVELGDLALAAVEAKEPERSVAVARSIAQRRSSCMRL